MNGLVLTTAVTATLFPMMTCSQGRVVMTHDEAERLRQFQLQPRARVDRRIGVGVVSK